jgi:hypothetical protein
MRVYEINHAIVARAVWHDSYQSDSCSRIRSGLETAAATQHVEPAARQQRSIAAAVEAFKHHSRSGEALREIVPASLPSQDWQVQFLSRRDRCLKTATKIDCKAQPLY